MRSLSVEVKGEWERSVGLLSRKLDKSKGSVRETGQMKANQVLLETLFLVINRLLSNSYRIFLYSGTIVAIPLVENGR